MKTYEFDYASAFGDTVSEKYESMYRIMRKHNEKYPIRFIVGSSEIISMIETMSVTLEHSPITLDMGGMKYVGKFFLGTRSIHIFKSERIARTDMVMFGEEENAVIKFVNFIFKEKK